MQTERKCWFCGKEWGLERHHVLSGTANRKLSERYGLWVYLCHDCHTGKDGAQYDPEKNRMLKIEAQMAFEALYSHDEWMKVFRRNYIFEHETVEGYY
jgi:hypothetical protein